MFAEEKKNGEEWRTYLREGKNIADGRFGRKPKAQLEVFADLKELVSR